jgi:hypothetical protein
MRGRRGCLAPCRPGEVVIVDGARYATNFLYNQRRPSWRRQTWPRTSRPVMLRLGMMTRRRCQVVGLARFNPNLRMLIVVIDAMLPHLTQADRRRHRPQRASRRPSSAFTIVAPAATARNNTDARNPVLDPRDTGIIANRAATVVNEVRVLTLRYNYSSSLRYFCPPCFAMTHERPLVCAFGVSSAIHNALGKDFHGLPMSPPKALAVIEGER